VGGSLKPLTSCWRPARNLKRRSCAIVVVCRRLRQRLSSRDAELLKLISRIVHLQQRLDGRQWLPIIRHTCAIAAGPSALELL
jgi:hypothetical protein